MPADEHLSGPQFQHTYDDVVAAGNDPFPAEKWGHTGRYARVSLPVARVSPEHSMAEYAEQDLENEEPYEQRYVTSMVGHLRGGGDLPPVLAHVPADSLLDGYHRLLAHRLAGREHIEAFLPEVGSGGHTDLRKRTDR